jgi:hypothetical protein
MEFPSPFDFDPVGSTCGAGQKGGFRVGNGMAVEAFHRQGQFLNHKLGSLAYGVFGGKGEGELEGFAFDTGIFPDHHHNTFHTQRVFGRNGLLQLFHKALCQRQFMHALLFSGFLNAEKAGAWINGLLSYLPFLIPGLNFSIGLLLLVSALY